MNGPHQLSCAVLYEPAPNVPARHSFRVAASGTSVKQPREHVQAGRGPPYELQANLIITDLQP